MLSSTHTFGGRLERETLNNSRDRAPDPVALFDFTFGPYSSLESFICHPTGHSGTPSIRAAVAAREHW